MNNDDLAKRFIDGSVKGTGSNMFIDGDTIYSYGYHFPIAKRLPKRRGKRGEFMFNSDKYSLTTSRHQDCVRQALRPINCIIYLAPRCSPHNIPDKALASLEEEVGKFLRARSKHTIRWLYQGICETIETWPIIKKRFGLKSRKLTALCTKTANNPDIELKLVEMKIDGIL